MEPIRPVVLHESEAEPEHWSDPVQGLLTFRTLFSAGNTPTGVLTTGVATLEPGGWLGAHRHSPAEVYHVLEGEGMLLLDGIEHEVPAGSSVFLPGDIEHGIRNAGTAPLRFFYAFAVDSFADIEYRFSGGQ